MEPRFRIFTYPEDKLDELLNYIDNGDVEWYYGEDVIVEHVETGVLIFVSKDGTYVADAILNEESVWDDLSQQSIEDVKEFIQSQQF